MCQLHLPNQSLSLSHCHNNSNNSNNSNQLIKRILIVNTPWQPPLLQVLRMWKIAAISWRRNRIQKETSRCNYLRRESRTQNATLLPHRRWCWLLKKHSQQSGASWSSAGSSAKVVHLRQASSITGVSTSMADTMLPKECSVISLNWSSPIPLHLPLNLYEFRPSPSTPQVTSPFPPNQ